MKLNLDEEDMVTDMDGFVYYWPKGCNGHFGAWYLRAIADELDSRNKEWNDQINAYHEELENNALVSQ